MTSEILNQILVNPPTGWIYFNNTDHALKYAAEILNSTAKYVHLDIQSRYFKKFYQEYKQYADPDFDQLAALAFQIQFQRECIQEIHKLVADMPASMFK